MYGSTTHVRSMDDHAVVAGMQQAAFATGISLSAHETRPMKPNCVAIQHSLGLGLEQGERCPAGGKPGGPAGVEGYLHD